MGNADDIEPGPTGLRRSHYQRVVFPAAGGEPELGGGLIFVGDVRVHVDHPQDVVFLKVQDDVVALAQELHRVGLLHGRGHALGDTVQDGAVGDRIECLHRRSGRFGQRIPVEVEVRVDVFRQQQSLIGRRAPDAKDAQLRRRWVAIPGGTAPASHIVRPAWLAARFHDNFLAVGQEQVFQIDGG